MSANYLESYLDQYGFRHNHCKDQQPMFTTFLEQIRKGSDRIMPPKDEEPEQSQQPNPDPPSQDDSTERERLLDPELDYLRKHSERIIEKKKS